MAQSHRGFTGQSTVEHPDRILRLAAMVRSLSEEVRLASLDEKGRSRLQEVHRRTVEALREVVSEDLQEELEALRSVSSPSASELRMAQAQLAGWLDGLYQGIQAAVAAGAPQEPGRPAQPRAPRYHTGQYL